MEFFLKVVKSIVLFIILLPLPVLATDCSSITAGQTASCTSVTQYGISFVFDKAYTCGIYANGDFWCVVDGVTSKVQLTGITPDYVAGHNGWEVNPATTDYWDNATQGFETDLGRFNAALIPALPYDASAGASIVKTIHNYHFTVSSANATAEATYANNGQTFTVTSTITNSTTLVATGTGNPEASGTLTKVSGTGDATISFTNTTPSIASIKTAAVLTILSSTPADNGSTLFRPPYVAGAKTSYSTSNIVWSNLFLGEDTAEQGITLAWVLAKHQRVQLSHLEGVLSRDMHPTDNLSDYGSQVGSDIIRSIIRMMFNGDSQSAKTPAMISILQHGIDWYYIQVIGHMQPSTGGGHTPGYKTLIAFTAYMLNDTTMKTNVTAAATTILNDGQTLWEEDSEITANAYGDPIYGDPTVWSGGELAYWTYTNSENGGNPENKDPYNYIDAEINHAHPNGVYQGCCTAGNIKGSVLLMRLMPGLAPIMNNALLDPYITRYVSYGVKTLPDPCAAPTARDYNQLPAAWLDYGTLWGSNGAGGCIQGSPSRLQSYDGNNADGYTGYSDGPLISLWWDAFYSSPAVIEKAGTSGGVSFSGGGMPTGGVICTWEDAYKVVFNNYYNPAVPRTLRNVIPANLTSGNGIKVKVTIHNAEQQSTTFSKVGICVKGTDVDCGAGTMKELTFNGASGKTLAANGTATSDKIDFTWTKTNQHLLTIESSGNIGQKYLSGQPSGYVTWFKNSVQEALTEDVSGFTESIQGR